MRGSEIFDLSFDIIESYRPFHVVAPNFVQVDEAVVGRLCSLRRTAATPPAPFAAVELEVAEVGDAGVAAGLVTTEGDHVLATFDPSRSRATIEVRHAGRSHVLARRKAILGRSFGFAFVVCENQVSALANSGTGWQPLVTSQDKVATLVDLSAVVTLSRYVFGYGTHRPGGRVTLGRVRAGNFGMVGVRDPHLVQRHDGSPYVRDGKLYLTLTCAGPGSFRQAHWGVFTLDLQDLTRLDQVAQLYAVRAGRVVGDHAGQVLVDETGERFIVANSSWGDFAPNQVHVRHLTTTDDVLSGVHRLETQRLVLPTGVNTWDPALTRIGDRWFVGFAESPSQDPFDFHPALAVGEPGGDHATGLLRVGADESVNRCEGPILQQIEGEWYLLASDGELREYRVYDLSMRHVGRLDAPYVSNIPHPQVVNLPSGDRLMITFDGSPYGKRVLGYGGHGELVIMAARSGSPVE